MSTCLIWNTAATVEDKPDSVLVTSVRAGGVYRVTGSAKPTIAGLSTKNKILLTDYIVEQQRLGTTPTISTATLQEIERRRDATTADRTTSFLSFLRATSPALGGIVKFFDSGLQPAFDGALAHSSSSTKDELEALALHCEREGWIERPVPTAKIIFGVRLTPSGHMRLEELDQTNQDSAQAFIAMWFDPSMDAAAHSIAEAVKQCGYRPLRIDRTEFADKVDDQIIAEIRRSRFVVADFTCAPEKPRGGVYYEAGFAKGLGLPVIWTVHTDALAWVHFDTRQYNHIVWSTPDDLAARLVARIGAVIGDGPFRPSA